MRNQPDDLATSRPKKLRFEDLHGCMKGTIKIMPGVDVAAPVHTPAAWAEWDRKWDEMLKPLDEKARE